MTIKSYILVGIAAFGPSGRLNSDAGGYFCRDLNVPGCRNK